MLLILTAKARPLLYSRRVFGGRKTVFFVASLVALCLLSLPVWPERETSSVELRTQEVVNTGALLGEGTQGSGAPPAEATTQPASPTPKNLKITVPKLGLKDVEVAAGLERKGVRAGKRVEL